MEIQRWSEATDLDKRKILAQLPLRLAVMAKRQTSGF
jgi:predicted Fe-S protein YdhL (DUF1289 family)